MAPLPRFAFNPPVSGPSLTLHGLDGGRGERFSQPETSLFSATARLRPVRQAAAPMVKSEEIWPESDIGAYLRCLDDMSPASTEVPESSAPSSSLGSAINSDLEAAEIIEEQMEEEDTPDILSEASESELPLPVLVRAPHVEVGQLLDSVFGPGELQPGRFAAPTKRKRPQDLSLPPLPKRHRTSAVVDAAEILASTGDDEPTIVRQPAGSWRLPAPPAPIPRRRTRQDR